MKRVYSRLAFFLILCALLTLTLSAACAPAVKGAEQSTWGENAENVTENGNFTYEPRPVTLPEDNTLRATFLIDYRWFTFRLVYNWTTETYSVYSQGELVVGDSINKKGELVAENVPGPAISSNGTYNPLDLINWFEVKHFYNGTIVYYDGIEVLAVAAENPVSSVIRVLSPENKTYNTTDVPLEYKVKITVYVTDATGNFDTSETVYFTVSSNNNGTEILAPQTDVTSTSTNEDNSNEIPPTIQQYTNIPTIRTMVYSGMVPSGFLASSIGASNFFLTYALIGILVTAASWFLTRANVRKHGR